MLREGDGDARLAVSAADQGTAQRRRDLAPEIEEAFQQFSKSVFQAGALSGKTKQLIAVAVAHVTQCPYCIRGHTKAASRDGATPRKRSWKPFGSRPRCARAAPTPIQRSPWMRSSQRFRTAAEKYQRAGASMLGAGGRALGLSCTGAGYS